MITKVKISPIERWCEHFRSGSKKYPLSPLLVGREVEIDILSLDRCRLPAVCDGHMWMLSKKTVLELRELANLPVSGATETFVCEHMLEMDQAEEREGRR